MKTRNKRKQRKERQKRQADTPAIDNQQQQPEPAAHNCCLSFEPNIRHHLQLAIKTFSNCKMASAQDQAELLRLRQQAETIRTKDKAETLRFQRLIKDASTGKAEVSRLRQQAEELHRTNQAEMIPTQASLEALRIKEMSEKLHLSESIVLAIRDADPKSDAALCAIDGLKGASVEKMLVWLKQLGFTIHTQLQPFEPYHNIGKPPQREFMPQTTSRFTH